MSHFARYDGKTPPVQSNDLPYGAPTYEAGYQWPPSAATPATTTTATRQDDKVADGAVSAYPIALPAGQHQPKAALVRAQAHTDGPNPAEADVPVPIVDNEVQFITPSYVHGAVGRRWRSVAPARAHGCVSAPS